MKSLAVKALLLLGVVSLLVWSAGQPAQDPAILRVPEEYPQIQAAVDAAPDGAIILIGPGEYRENLTITKSLALRGAGPEQTIIWGIDQPRYTDPVGATFVTVYVEAQASLPPHVILQDLKIRALKEKKEGPDDYVAVYVQGDVQLFMQGNYIAGADGIKVKGVERGSQISLWRNTIVSSAKGITVFGNGDGHLGETTPLQLFLRENTIRMDGGTGLYVSGAAGASIMFIESEIRGAGLAANVFHGGEVSILKSMIHDNERGISLLGGRVSIINSEIRETQFTGIVITAYEWGASELEVRNSKITNNQEYGVAITDMCFPDDDGLVVSPTNQYTIERIRILGQGNIITGNLKGDLCPVDFMWPGLFRSVTIVDSPTFRNPAGLAVNPNGQFVYVANDLSDAVSVIDTASNSIVATILVRRSPVDVAVSPNGRFVYIVHNEFDGFVSVIDTASNSVVATTPVGHRPNDVAVNPNGQFVYVSNSASGTMSVIDTTTNSVVATIPVSGGIAVTPNGRFIYVTGSLKDKDSVSVIDTASNSVLATIPVGRSPVDVAVSPNGQFAYATNGLDGTVSVIATASNSVIATIPVSKSPNMPYRIVVTPNGRFLYLTIADVIVSQVGSVEVIDTVTNSVVATVDVGGIPVDLAVTPDSRFVYVTVPLANGSRQILNVVSVIDTTTNTVVATIR